MNITGQQLKNGSKVTIVDVRHLFIIINSSINLFYCA